MGDDRDETLAFVLPGLRGLRTMLVHAGRFPEGVAKADEMVQATLDCLRKRAPYPMFCGQPERCVLAGRCTREIVCND